MKALICIKDSPKAEHLLEFYSKYLHRPEDEVLVLHVSEEVKLPAYVHAGGVGYIPQKLGMLLSNMQRKNNAIRNKYGEFCGRLGMDHKLILKEYQIGVGETIVETAKVHEVNLIVMGSRDLGTFGRLFLGSVDEYVKQHCTIPTLVCPSLHN